MARRSAHGQIEVAKLERLNPETGAVTTLLVMSTGKVLRNWKPEIGPSVGWKLNQPYTDILREFGLARLLDSVTPYGFKLVFNHGESNLPAKYRTARATRLTEPALETETEDLT
jgi:hypothetical protein